MFGWMDGCTEEERNESLYQTHDNDDADEGQPVPFAKSYMIGREDE